MEQSDVKGPVVFMSPEWRRLVRHAISEADRLGLELAIENCEGWSESGGPWVSPPQAMQRVVWTETQVSGGSRIKLALPQPPATNRYYRDLAVLAFPTPSGDDAFQPDSVSTPAGPVVFPFSVPSPIRGLKPQWVCLGFPERRTFRSIRIVGTGQLWDSKDRPQPELQASDDGREFHRVCEIRNLGTTVFEPASGRFFRVWIPVEQPREKPIEFAQIVLGGSRLDRTEALAGMAADESVNRAPGGTFPVVDALAAGSIVDLSGRGEWEAPAGSWTLVRLGHTGTGIINHPASKATEGLECDKMSAAAVTAHIENGMLGAVVSDAGPLVGRGLKYVLCDSWEAGCENWTPLLRFEFERRRGYDPTPWLLALTGRVIGSEELTRRFLWDYRRTLADLVAENHYGVIQAYAHRHGMGLYAEAVGIAMPTVADELQCKGYTDIPMGEFWVDRETLGTPVEDCKEAASAAHIYGQNIAAAEAFTAMAEVGGWSKDPWSLKELGDREFCLGINRFVFHRYAHQPWLDRRPGMSMGPWGTNFERTNTWWEPGAAWVAYLSRCQFLLQQGRFAADLCYLYGEGAPVCLRTANLIPAPPAGYDYDACDVTSLLRMQVKDGRIVLPSGMSYRVLVLPAGDTMSLPVLEKVAALVEQGATVVGPKPARTPGLTGYPASDERLRALADKVWGEADGRRVLVHPFGLGRVCWGLPLAQALATGPDFTSANPDIRFIHRHLEGAEVYFLSNPERTDLTVDCSFRVAGKQPEIWHPDTGAVGAAAEYSIHDGVTTLPVHFDPLGSAFVLFRGPCPALPVVAKVEETHPLPAWAQQDARTPAAGLPEYREGALSLTAWEPARYRLVGADGAVHTASSEGLPAPIGLSGPWTVEFPPKLGAPPSAVFGHLMSWTESPEEGIHYFSGTAVYRKAFELPGSWTLSGRRVFVDLGSVRNLARVRVNGVDIGVLWKEPFRVEITGAVHPGPNWLEVAVTNLWPNRMIGDAGKPQAERITWASVEPFTRTTPLLDSGLLGPVLLRAAWDLKPVPATP